MTPDDRTLSDEAIRWRVRLRSDALSEQDARDFEAWKNRSDRHREAYARIEELWQELDDPSRDVWQDLRHGLDPLRHDLPSESALPSTSTMRWRPAASIAAAVVVVILAGFWLMDLDAFQDPGTIRTALGERKSVTLDDGSTVHLNTNTAVAVRYEAARRVVQLTEGEAWFSVAPDHTRPFEVVAGNGTTRAVGTEFNVREESDGATVTVVDGIVEVSQTASAPAASRQVAAGERVSYSHRAGIGSVSRADLIQTSGWRRGQLVFESKPLGEVVAEVDRYWPGKILVMNSDLRRHPISGVFKTGDSEAVVHALESTFRIKSIKLAPYLILLY